VRVLDGELVLSPSDLNGFAACRHLTQLELSAARGEVVRPERHDPLLEVLSRRGLEHEAAVVNRRRDAGRRVVTIDGPKDTRADLEALAAATEAAMRDGADVIYQATFLDGRWHGFADFVERVDRPSGLGDWSYEVADAKLARSVKAAAVVQLCAYSERVAAIQGVEPEHLHVVTGDDACHSLRVADCSAYFRRLKSDFENLVLGEPEPTYPEPVEHCAVCRWAEPCAQRRRDDDHLSLVAGLRRDQIHRLAEQGIATRAALARAAPTDRPPRMGEQTFERLRHQAALQVRGDGCAPPLYELLPVVRIGDGVGHDDAGEADSADDDRPRGLAALPKPSPGDLFLDLEGDPYVGGGLEYLWGIVDVVRGKEQYHEFWAHDRAGEKRAFEDVIDLIVERRAKHPRMHVYHYAPYEPTAIRRLMGAYGTREAEVDALLRGEVFVDLFQVVRHAIRLSTESYSLKEVEKLYLVRPAGAVMDAGSSIVAYEDWLLDPQPYRLDEIAAYNRDDCSSTRLLREWFERQRAEVEETDGPIPRPVPPARDSADLEAELAAVDALAAELSEDVPGDPAERDEQQHARGLLAQLLHWHRREDKPAWWRYYDRIRPDRTDEDFFEDSECIGGLTGGEIVGHVKKSTRYRFGFAPQEHKFKVGQMPDDPAIGKGVGTIDEIGDDFLVLRRATSSGAPWPRALIPSGPVRTDNQKAALVEIAVWVRDHGVNGRGRYRAARDLLLRRGPRRAPGAPSPLVQAGEPPVDAACRLVVQLDAGCLAIQGPPGTGKTYTAAHMVLALLAAGKKVGITAQSHAVISNLLTTCLDEADELGVEVPAIQKAKEVQRCDDDRVIATEGTARVVKALRDGDAMLAAGTSWLWCHPEMRDAVDVLFVEEAGQFSLADAMAVSVAARNLVLLGDPQQLAQVSQGSHPDGADASALAHLLGDHATMPADLGLFLDTTYRMHPAVCEFISDVVYDGKLESRPGLEQQLVGGTGLLAGAGLRVELVEHDGDTTSSPVEAEVVGRLVDEAIGRTWIDEKGKRKKLQLRDVLVVAPYNAQVAEIRRHLPDGARVGTVDKFQGQEAPVTIYSMASSSADDAPRGMDFLYDLHRLNVAVSRARSVSMLVCSPHLQRVLCKTPEQIRLANSTCRFVEAATSAETRLQPVPLERR